jgi:hypothetical protein
MKYDIKYYYSPSTHGVYCHEANGYDIPSDAVEITNETWVIKEQNPNYVFHFTNEYLDVVNPDSLLTPEELEEQLRQQTLNYANRLFIQSTKFESGGYQRRMTTEEQNEFVMWQDALLEFIDGDRTELPPTPEFIQGLL